MITIEEAFRGGKKTISLRNTNPRTGQTRTETYEVKIPPGILPGTRIRLGGRGEPGAGQGPAGDLYLRIHIAPDPDFRLEEEGLVFDLDANPWKGAGPDAATANLLDTCFALLFLCRGTTPFVKIPTRTATGTGGK